MARRKKGEGSWGKKTINGNVYVRYRDYYDGERKEFYGRTTKEVKDKIEKFENNTNGTTNQEIKKEILSEYIKNWMGTYKVTGLKDGSYDTMEDTLRLYITPYRIGDLQMGNLREDIISDHFKNFSTKYSKSTINKTYNLLSQCLSKAKAKGDISINPMELIELPKEIAVASKKKEISFLSIDDIDKLRIEAYRLNTKQERINGEPGTRVYGNNAYYVLLIMDTGMRIGEALALTWNDINFEKNYIQINKSLSEVKNRNIKDGDNKYIRKISNTKTKSGNRFIPLTDSAKETLKVIKTNSSKTSPNDLVILTSKNKSPSQSTITRTLNSMQLRAGCEVEKCGLHALRHSFGSVLIAEGIDIKVVSELLGHADISTTYNIYIHIQKEQKISAINVLNRLNKKKTED